MPEMTDEQRKALEEKIKNMSPEELKEFQKQQCIFCQIITGKIPSKKVYSDDKCIAVMDINPASKGHLLIMPKEHYAIMPQMPDKEIGHLFLVSKYLSQILLKSLKVSGTNVFVANGGVAGQRAQHFMLHLIPRKEGDKVLDVEDKLIDVQLRTKVKELVEPKLLALLGVKKEKQTTLPQPKVELPEEEIEVGEEHQEEKVIEVSEEVEEPPKKKTKAVKEKKSAPKAAKKAKEPSKREEVGLDDIADLFK